MHTDTVGVVLNIRNALNALVLDEICDVLDQARLVYLVGQLCYDNLESAVLRLDDFRAGADGDFSLAGRVCGADTAPAHDDAARREVGSRQTFHQLGELDVGIFYVGAGGVDSLTEVVRRNFGSHTYGDTARAINEKVRETAGQHDRLL